MQYIEAPQTYSGETPSLFIAGGITGCPDWQQELGKLLSDTTLVIFNPRRAHFSPDEQSAWAQISWEYRHLRQASAISFWFPQEALCPIALYELGAWSVMNKPIFVGVHPAYQRFQDVMIQTALTRPKVPLVTSLQDLAHEITAWAERS